MDIESEDGETAKKGFENIVVFQNDPIYQDHWDHARMIVCRFSVDDDFDMKDKRVIFKPIVIDMLDVVSIPIQDERGEQSRVDCWMEISKGRFPQTNEIDGAVKVGSPLTLAIFVKDPRKRTDVRIKDCYAYDDPKVAETNGPALLQLTDFDGCPTKPKLIDVWKRTHDTGDTGATVIAFTTVTAFKFPDRPDLQLTCNIELCRNKCASRCSSEMPEPVAVGVWSKASVDDGSQITQKPTEDETEKIDNPTGKEEDTSDSGDSNKSGEDAEESKKNADASTEKAEAKSDEKSESDEETDGEKKEDDAKTEEKSEDKSEAKTDEKSEEKSDEKAEEKPEEKTKEKAEEKTDEKADEDKSDEESEDKEEEKPTGRSADGDEKKSEESSSEEKTDDSEKKNDSSAEEKDDESAGEEKAEEDKKEGANKDEEDKGDDSEESGNEKRQVDDGEDAHDENSISKDEDEDEDEDEEKASTTTTTTTTEATTTTAKSAKLKSSKSKAARKGKSTSSSTGTKSSEKPKAASQVLSENSISSTEQVKNIALISKSKGKTAVKVAPIHLSTTTLRPLKELMDYSAKKSIKTIKKVTKKAKQTLKTTTEKPTTTSTTTQETTTTKRAKKHNRPAQKSFTQKTTKMMASSTTNLPRYRIYNRRARHPSDTHPLEFAHLHQPQESSPVEVFYNENPLRRSMNAPRRAYGSVNRTGSSAAFTSAATAAAAAAARQVTPAASNFRRYNEAEDHSPDIRSFYSYSHFQPQRIRHRNVRSVDPVMFDPKTNSVVLGARVITGLEVV